MGVRAYSFGQDGINETFARHVCMCYILFIMLGHSDRKNLPRLFVPQNLVFEGTCDLSENQIHYLRNVLRFQSGAQLLIFNGRDGEWLAELTEIGKKRGAVKPLRQMRPQTPSPDILAAFAPVKKTRLDFMIEKATELGASKLIPVLTERCIVSRVNTERMTAQAVEAAEQCARMDVPDISEPATLPALLEKWDKNRILIVCAERGDSVPFRAAVQRAQNKPVAILTGPEGGFTDAELDLLAAQEFTVMADLGPRILRAETALIAALSGLLLHQ
ncbi:MAG: 16S rRNA (uracil(1498)-N(3))-methyltransferase [Micavibrio sp.]|nr:MAG: 16S rRNA (uracil(1498)-N(3))-methyltransferase [Micavibrio sp.]